MGILNNIFDPNAKEIKKYQKTVAQINALEPSMQALSDEELRGRTKKFRARVQQGTELRELLPEAFAVVREASRRVLRMRHFDVQLIGGMVLFDGRIAEMKTGEGKTLVATCPAYLHALSGRGVHVITVNDYLASRDSEWMGRVYRFLGLTVGLITRDMSVEAKKAAYAADITYGTNNEFGFDYLRDNMAFNAERMVQRPLHYCIVDEVDSILIDEARTPLIISGPSGKPADTYFKAAKFVRNLHEAKELTPEKSEQNLLSRKEGVQYGEGDYTLDIKTRQVALTEQGVARAEQFFGVDNLYDPQNTELSHHINNALRALYLFRVDRDYVVKDGEVIIVDEFTGRLMFGRRYSDGLHEAIEAKENLVIQRESQTLASITLQNYFRMYDILAGMTGTAATEEAEFVKIYSLDVVEVPSNLPNIRIDRPDTIYRTRQSKYDAVVDEICEKHAEGRPVLVGTTSIEKSELLSSMLEQRGIEHRVLNAKLHSQEALIVAQAGRRGAVTIATNMAGRGTDILLGGNPESMAREELEQNYLKDHPELARSREELRRVEQDALAARKRLLDPQSMSRKRLKPNELEKLQQQYTAEYNEMLARSNMLAAEIARLEKHPIDDAELERLTAHYRTQTESEHEEVVRLGGLHIIGTERHESRRIDNQLRGRAGRQGDPGSTHFFLSIEDELVQRFGNTSLLSSAMAKVSADDKLPLELPMVSKIIESAQRRVEERNFESRKTTVEYDDVMNGQRELIYSERRKALTEPDVHDSVLDMIDAAVELIAEPLFGESNFVEEWDIDALLAELDRHLPHTLPDQTPAAPEMQLPTADELRPLERAEVVPLLRERFRAFYAAKCEQQGTEKISLLEHAAILRSVDRAWMDHLDAMDQMRQGIGMRAYGQHDPLIEYKKEAFDMFDAMVGDIRLNVTRTCLFLVLVDAPTERRDTVTNREDGRPRKKQPVRKDSSERIGRNELCPCGSGKKYKQCCGRGK